ncbi:hypothetical protein IMPERIA89_420030 [Imperialibacter sp. 89]|nr:hypothetical protein IMPERIA89_420030 [Imperialibacter sp. 89]CAD5295295.1 hypothetical protein IMPERIA75_690029 [Imperialibacter sp. 75]
MPLKPSANSKVGNANKLIVRLLLSEKFFIALIVNSRVKMLQNSSSFIKRKSASVFI